MMPSFVFFVSHYPTHARAYAPRVRATNYTK
jgi:hypothetical protein